MIIGNKDKRGQRNQGSVRHEIGRTDDDRIGEKIGFEPGMDGSIGDSKSGEWGMIEGRR